MANLLAPHRPDPKLPVFFNVDGVVGASPAENYREDVLLVQFALVVIARSTFPTTDRNLVAAAKDVKLTGVIDAATIAGIRAIQEYEKEVRPGQIVDGRVSPARGGYSYGGRAVWAIGALNRCMQMCNVNIWPRIDLIAGCPAELKKLVTRTVAGLP